MHAVCHHKVFLKNSLFSILFILSFQLISAQTQEVIQLWTNEVPNQVEPKSKPKFSDKTEGDITRIKKVTDPSLTVYTPEKNIANGIAVIICPGGAYNILAIDKEGYEVAKWLSEQGYTAFVLQYRVPKNRAGALQDAQRAIRLVRAHSKKWQISPDRIGMLGFSAGGSLCARASTCYNDKTYSPIDQIDTLSARPNFSILIYPAYLDAGKDKTLTPELKIDENTPPMFLFVASDDKYVNSSLVMASALQKNKQTFELHILPTGGHGFGMRAGNPAAETWPKLCLKWIKSILPE